MRLNNDDKTAHIQAVCLYTSVCGPRHNPPSHTNVISQCGFPKLGYHPLGPRKATRHTHRKTDRDEEE
jgi:hypothetical protein